MKPTRLLFSPLAETQILEAFNRYRLSSSQRAQNWMDSVDEAFTAIEHHPLICQVVFDDVRRLKVKNSRICYFISWTNRMMNVKLRLRRAFTNAPIRKNGALTSEALGA